MNALEIKHLNKSYGSFQLKNLNLVLPQGCIMGLIGENGAGKSTTIKLILDMIHKDSGTITIFGKENKDHLKVTKEDIGVVLDEVGIPGCLNPKQVGHIMKHVYKNWQESVYEDYLTRWELPSKKQFSDFSRGMKMKLGIAVAMSHQPKLLILDEATNGLDPVVRDQVTELFYEFTRQEDHAVLMSSHIVSDLEKISDYIAFLHKGNLLLCEEKDRLLEQYGILHCTADQMRSILPEAVMGKKETSYGVEALVRRDAVPSGFQISPISIEELFVFMVKGGR